MSYLRDICQIYPFVPCKVWRSFSLQAQSHYFWGTYKDYKFQCLISWMFSSVWMMRLILITFWHMFFHQTRSATFQGKMFLWKQVLNECQTFSGILWAAAGWTWWGCMTSMIMTSSPRQSGTSSSPRMMMTGTQLRFERHPSVHNFFFNTGGEWNQSSVTA